MRQCPSCGGDCGYTKKKGCQYQSGESEWIGLTDEEIQECLQGLPTQTIDVYARRIEAKLKEKNGY